MKHLSKSMFSLLLLLSIVSINIQTNAQVCCPTVGNTSIRGLNTNTPVHTYINYRSQGANTARELVGWQTEIYRPTCDFYSIATFAFEYTRSFREKSIAYDWFGADCLRFQGSNIITNRNPNALVADYFGLGPNFNERLCFNPQIENFIFDWNIFVGLDPLISGLFFRAHFPLVYSKWTLFSHGSDCFHGSCVPTPAPTTTVGDCFISDTIVNTGVSNISQALAPGLPQAGQIFGANTAGGICSNTLTDTKLADIDIILGWLLFNHYYGHLGFYLQYVAPTGTRPNFCGQTDTVNLLFSPQIGNGYHHELGVGVTSHIMVWDDSIANSFAIYLEGNVTHMFSNKQFRLFDLCQSGAYSRYILLREFNSDGTPTGNLVTANNTNITNRLVDVKIDAKVDFSLKFAYRHCNWAFDVGYNIYYHSKEEIDNLCCKKNCFNNYNNLDNFRYGVAGLTGICCFNYPLIGDGTPGCIVDTDAETTTSVIATVPNANMFTPETSMVPLADAITTGDSVCLAWNSTLPAALGVLPTCAELTAANGIRPIQGALASPVFIEPNAINLDSGLSPAYLTHKVFFHLNYMWCDWCGFNPFIGIGGEIEFSGNNNINNNCYSYCNNINNIKCNNNYRVGLNQWGIWIKFGLSL